jgi:NADH-quinone oxidoreductase subunit F
MDLRITGAEPSPEERAAVDALLGPPQTTWDGGLRNMDRDGRASAGARALADRRHLLLPALHAVQDRMGWVSRGALNYICRRLSVPPAEAWGVLTFYHLLSASPRPARVAHVCDDIVCRLHGAEALCGDLERRLGPPLDHPDAAGADAAADAARHAPPAVGWQRSPCLGQCDHGSAALITRAGERPVRFTIAPVPGADAIGPALRDDTPPVPAVAASVGALGPARLLARVRRGGARRLDAYRAGGGYRALAKAIELGAERVIAEVGSSKLLGRGGAAFPTGRKWDAVRRQPALPHYVVCNADESEPGTFKDRVLMEDDPCAVVEAMTICGLATRSEYGYIYVRGEYPLAEARMAGAIQAARAAGLLGANAAGSGVAFDIEVRRGGGAYICGEETALFNSVEGRRGEPRSKPPFPAEAGLFGKPTVVNNVETLVNVLDIVLLGGEAWAATGTASSTGTRLFCVAGRIARPGLYEVPFGTTLRDVLDLAGGPADGRPVRAILLGGAAGTFVGPASLDLPLTFEDVRAAGATLGSGVVLVYDETADLPDALARIAEFFRHESCGQCVPCRVGTVRQQELLGRMRTAASGSDGRAKALEDELALLKELGQAMRDASICGLGQTASSAIETALAIVPLFRANAEPAPAAAARRGAPS